LLAVAAQKARDILDATADHGASAITALATKLPDMCGLRDHCSKSTSAWTTV
jgi:hypothetical protein